MRMCETTGTNERSSCFGQESVLYFTQQHSPFEVFWTLGFEGCKDEFFFCNKQPKVKWYFLKCLLKCYVKGCRQHAGKAL